MGSIFTDINLPNPTTWFYFSGLLAVALFFKFGRVFSLRNLDVLALYLFGPGFLLLAEGSEAWLGYACLLLASGHFLIRCLLDLSLERRPALGTNLDLSGLGWLAGALYISLVAVAVRQPDRLEPPPPAKVPTDSAPQLVAKALPDISIRVAGRGLALLCHLSVAVGLVMVGWRVFEDLRSGMAAATFYLLLPYTFFLVPDSPVSVGRWDHAWPMALMVWSVVAYRMPLLAGAFLGLATGPAYYLVVTLPAWLSFYYQRGAARFLVGFVLAGGLSVALVLGLMWWYGEVPAGLRSDWATWNWLPWKAPAADTTGFWQLMPGMAGRSMTAYRVPVFLASMALVFGSALWPRPKNLAHVLALSAAALISLQFWLADRGGIYVLWYLPLVLLIVFRPNMSECRPPELPANGWLARLTQALLGLLNRLIPGKRQAVTVPSPDEPDDNHRA